MANVLGMDCILYRNTGTYLIPIWNEVANVKDLTLSLEKAEADVTTRANEGWRATVGTLKDASIEFGMVYNTADLDFTAFQEAFIGNTTIELAVMDGDITDAGTQGLRATCDIMSFSREEPLEEAASVAVTAKPTFADNAPEWYEIAS